MLVLGYSTARVEHVVDGKLGRFGCRITLDRNLQCPVRLLGIYLHPVYSTVSRQARLCHVE